MFIFEHIYFPPTPAPPPLLPTIGLFQGHPYPNWLIMEMYFYLFWNIYIYLGMSPLGFKNENFNEIKKMRFHKKCFELQIHFRPVCPSPRSCMTTEKIKLYNL